MQVTHSEDRTQFVLTMNHLEAVHALEALREQTRTYRELLSNLNDIDMLGNGLEDAVYYANSIKTCIDMVWALEESEVI